MIVLISVVENSRNKPSAIGLILQKSPTTQGTKKPGGKLQAFEWYKKTAFLMCIAFRP